MFPLTVVFPGAKLAICAPLPEMPTVFPETKYIPAFEELANAYAGALADPLPRTTLALPVSLLRDPTTRIVGRLMVY